MVVFEARTAGVIWIEPTRAERRRALASELMDLEAQASAALRDGDRRRFRRLRGEVLAVRRLLAGLEQEMRNDPHYRLLEYGT
jgi:hypothetical protein